MALHSGGLQSRKWWMCGEASVAGLEGAVGCVRGLVLYFIQEELKHFEVKIEKHNHYQKQLKFLATRS